MKTLAALAMILIATMAQAQQYGQTASSLSAPPFAAYTVDTVLNGTTDKVFIWGYNVEADNRRVDPTKGMLSQQFEGSYFDGQHLMLEWNGNTISADGSKVRRYLGFDVRADNPDAQADWLFSIAPVPTSTFCIAPIDDTASASSCLWRVDGSGASVGNGPMTINVSTPGSGSFLRLLDYAGGTPALDFYSTPGRIGSPARNTIAQYEGGYAQLVVYNTFRDNAASWWGLQTTTPSGAPVDALTVNSDGTTSIGTGGSPNKLVCWKPDARTLGHCSTAPDSEGGCVCE